MIPEPEGGAHTQANDAVDAVGEALARQLDDLRALYKLDAPSGARALLEARRAKFRVMGEYAEI